MVGIRTLLRNLAPVVGTHKALPQSVFRVGLAGEDKPGVQASTDLLKFVAHLNNAQHTRCEKVGDDTYVISTLEQARQILETDSENERPVGLSLFSKYSSVMSLNLVKHLYYLPAIYGRLPEFVNLVDDGVPFHYLLNPSAPRTNINTVRKEYEQISIIASQDSHERYIKFLDSLPAGSITPWRKVPKYGSEQANTDREFIKEYGPMLPPTKKPTLRALFGEIMGTVPVEVLPIVEMCREKAMNLFDVYDATIDDKEKDMIGVEITRIFDVARNSAITFSAFSAPQPAPWSYSSATPHAYSPIFHRSPMGVRMYSTLAREHNPLTMLSPDVIKEFREYFLDLWHKQGEDEDKAADLAGDVYRLLSFIEKIDKCGAFGKTPCPHDGGWPW